jgi:hypothetical protein
MSTPDYTPIRDRAQRTYTLDEAVDLMKMLDKFPTREHIRWVNAKTRKPVVIGYNK